MQKGSIAVLKRPKSPVTLQRQIVMWFHYDNSSYGLAHLGVAVSDRPIHSSQPLLAERIPVTTARFTSSKPPIRRPSPTWCYLAEISLLTVPYCETTEQM